MSCYWNVTLAICPTLTLIPTLSFLLIAGCSETRRDPCTLISPIEMKSLDADVTSAAWAGRDEEKRSDEVCMYYAADGDPRVMLFAWYDTGLDAGELVKRGVADNQAEISDVPGKDAAVAFADGELKLLTAKSEAGVVGLRVRKPVTRDSEEMGKAMEIAQKALSRL